jgi:hypothetical protein
MMPAVTGMCLEVCSLALSALAHRRNRPLTSVVCVGLIFHPPIFHRMGAVLLAVVGIL